jgi:hypothetical protein
MFPAEVSVGLRKIFSLLLRAVNCFAIVFWALIPLLILLSFYVPQLSGSIGSLEAVSVLSIVWAISFLIVFLFLLLPEHSTDTQNHGLQGLLCTLTLGLPSIVLAAFPLVGPPAYAARPVLDFKGTQRAKDVPAHYFVAIDVSHSFSDRSEDRIKLASDVITQIFSEDGLLGSSIRANDRFEIWTFAGKDTIWQTNESGGRGQIDRRKDMIDSVSRGDLGPLPEDILCPNATDIITPLSSIVSKLEDPSSTHSFARIILFSDLVQSSSASSSLTECNSTDQGRDKDFVERKIKNLLDRIKKLPQVRIVAFSAPTKPGPSTQEGKEVNMLLRKDFEGLGEQWQEVDLLTDWKNADTAARLLLPSALYADIQPLPISLQLWYIAHPSMQPRLSQLDLPSAQDSGDLVFGLKAVNIGERPIRLNLRTEGTADARILSLAQGETAYQTWATENGPAPALVELNCGKGTPDTEYPELIVASPSRSFLYRIPLELVSYKESRETEMARLVLLLLNALPIILGCVILREALPARVARFLLKPFTDRGSGGKI